MFKKVILDLESNNLMEPMLDFNQRPLRFKPEFTVWCVSLRDIESNLAVMLIRPDLLENIQDYAVTDEHREYLKNAILRPLTKEQLKKCLDNCEELIAHNGVKFDFPVLKLMDYLDYNIGYPYFEKLDNSFNTETTVFNKETKITDTLLWSKLLNADRYGGHSLANFGSSSEGKLDFEDFDNFSVDMLIYCERDTLVNKAAYELLMEEKGDYAPWDSSYAMEIKLAEYSLHQELFGFYYDSELSESNKVELDKLLKERYDEVTPSIPPRALNKTETGKYTPPATKFSKTKNRLSVYMERFFERVGANYDPIAMSYEVDGETYDLYYEGCVKTSLPASIDDLAHLKGYLISLGWEPSEWGVRDLTKHYKTKRILPWDKFQETVIRYAEDTFSSPFTTVKLKELEVLPSTTKEELIEILLDRYGPERVKPIVVPTTPKLKVGASKDICPNLEELGKSGKFNFVTSVVEYLTYKHRRNSIASGIDEESGEPQKGFESYVRTDGRISTPVDTLATNTSRMAHKIVNTVIYYFETFFLLLSEKKYQV